MEVCQLGVGDLKAWGEPAVRRSAEESAVCAATCQAGLPGVHPDTAGEEAQHYAPLRMLRCGLTCYRKRRTLWPQER